MKKNYNYYNKNFNFLFYMRAWGPTISKPIWLPLQTQYISLIQKMNRVRKRKKKLNQFYLTG